MKARAAIRRTKDGALDGRSMIRVNHLDRAEAYLAQPRTLNQLKHRLRISRRTAYVLLEELNASGRLVARIGPHSNCRFIMAARLAKPSVVKALV